MPKISNINLLSQDSQGNISYQGKKLSVWWGKTLYYFDKNSNELHYKHFNLFELFFRVLGCYLSRFHKAKDLKEYFPAHRDNSSTSSIQPPSPDKGIQDQKPKSGGPHESASAVQPHCTTDEANIGDEVEISNAFQDEEVQIQEKIALGLKLKEKEIEAQAEKLLKEGNKGENNEDELIKKINGKTLSANGKIQAGNEEVPLIAHALENKMYSLAKVLVENGANPNEVCFLGKRPLEFAIQAKNPSLIRSLIEKGADVNAGQKNSPLSSAIRFFDYKDPDEWMGIIQLLIEKGAKTENVEIEPVLENLAEEENKVKLINLFKT